MPKKKQSIPAISEEQQLEALQSIAQLPPEQQQELLALAEEFEQLQEDKQDAMLSFLQQMSQMSDDEQDRFLDNLESSFGFGDDSASDEGGDYPHFLPRPNVHKYTLRVTLRGLKPAIYRKFCVPSNITLRHLSELLLELMGWEGYHLNQFRKGFNFYAPAYQREDEIPVLFGPARNYNQEDYTLSDLLSEKGKSIEWEYDFGDSWYHDIRLSSIGDYAEGEPLITFIKGERECPPEDCGSIWGYQELLELHEKRKSRKRLTSEEKGRLEWYGMDGDFDPTYFDTNFARELCEEYCK